MDGTILDERREGPAHRPRRAPCGGNEIIIDTRFNAYDGANRSDARTNRKGTANNNLIISRFEQADFWFGGWRMHVVVFCGCGTGCVWRFWQPIFDRAFPCFKLGILSGISWRWTVDVVFLGSTRSNEEQYTNALPRIQPGFARLRVCLRYDQLLRKRLDRVRRGFWSPGAGSLKRSLEDLLFTMCIQIGAAITEPSAPFFMSVPSLFPTQTTDTRLGV